MASEKEESEREVLHDDSWEEQVDEDTNDDNSIVVLHPDNMDKMQLFLGCESVDGWQEHQWRHSLWLYTRTPWTCCSSSVARDALPILFSITSNRKQGTGSLILNGFMFSLQLKRTCFDGGALSRKVAKVFGKSLSHLLLYINVLLVEQTAKQGRRWWTWKCG